MSQMVSLSIHACPNIIGFITYKQVVIRPDDQSVSEAVDEETMLLVKSYGQVTFRMRFHTV